MYGFVHHLLLATTIASVLVLVHTTIVYRALDIGTHYVIASLLGPVERSHLPPGQHPTVLLLTPAVSREMTGALAGLVRRMTTEWRPPVQANLRRVLVVAIDLAPLLDDTSDAERRQQKDLDAALDEAVRCGVAVVRGEPIIGPKRHPRDAERLAWLVERCAAGVHFGMFVARELTRPRSQLRDQRVVAGRARGSASRPGRTRSRPLQRLWRRP